MSVTLHVFGNLQAFQQGLVGVQMLFNPANNTAWASGGSLFGGGGLVLVGLLISALIIFTKGIFTQRLELHHVFLLALMYGIMFVPTTSVVLDDVLSGQQAVVDSIPVGIAYPAAIVSDLSYDAGLQISQAFQSVTQAVPPTDISQGFVSPLQTLFAMRNFYSTFASANPSLAKSIMYYAEYCALGSGSSMQSLNNTTVMLGSPNDGHAGLFSNPPPNKQVIIFWDNSVGATQGTTVTCASAASTLSTALANYFSDQPTAQLTTCSQNVGKLTTGPQQTTQNCSGVETLANSVLVDASQGTGTIITQLANNGQNFLSNMIGGCLISAGFQYGTSPYGDVSASLPSYCGVQTANLDYQQAINAASANTFEQNMLPLMSIMQFLFFVLAPFAAGMMVMMGVQGFSLFAKYLMFGAWTQSWLPLAALINDLIQLSAQHAFGRFGLSLTNGMGSGTSAQLVYGSNLSTIFEKTAIFLSNANMMLSMTPLLTMALFSGSYFALSKLGEKMDGGSSSKNLDIASPTLDKAGNALGIGSNAAGEYFQTNPLAQSASVGIASAAQSSISAMKSQADQSSMSAMQSAGRVGSSVWSVMDQAQHNTAAAKDLSATGGQQWADTYKSVQGFAKETGLSDSQATSFLAQVGAGLDSGLSLGATINKAESALAKLNGGGDMSAEMKGKVEDALKNSQTQKTARDLSSSHTANLAQQVAQKYQIGDQASKSGGLTRQAQQTEQETQQAQQQYQKADQLQHQFSKTGMLQSGLNLSASTLAGTLLARYGSAPAAISAANSMAARTGVGDAYDKAVTAGKAAGMSSETAAAYGLVMALPQAKDAEGFEQIADLAGAEMPAGAAVAGGQIASTQNSLTLAAGQFHAHAPDQSKVSDKGFKALKKEEADRQKAYQPVNQTGIASSATPAGLYKEADQGVVSTPPGGIDPKKAGEVTGNKLVEAAGFMHEHPTGTLITGLAADGVGAAITGKAVWNQHQAQKAAEREKEEKDRAKSDPDAKPAEGLSSVAADAAPASAEVAGGIVGAVTGISEVVGVAVLASQAVDGAERMANSSDPNLIQHQLDTAYKADGVRPLDDFLPKDGSAKGGDK
ncbi:conjugal transfer protein TraG N-terminal domain-containing protein [Thiomonas delicata]|uniref:TraG N-terminal Proteobacteria domain-containing protein n=1 Tax=Thiomonas delicata TaxID=364030 RepID=A0A238D721_THIDL|nr:conjugal transfer protein TraG N-terminal domain-containing protein [Thiomonas delicata]SBP88944.1 membrane hypothetical protein [Thiomonas delicata]